MSSDEFASFGLLLLLLLSTAHLGGYTALVILAVVTSQAAGAWLDYVVRSGLPLLTERIATATAEGAVL